MADFGLLIFSTDYAIAPNVLAQQAEMHGFESLFFPEHTHIPASRATPWPGGRDLPKEYWHTHDPFVALTAAASVTQKLKVGTGIALVTERDPILMAKQAATLDLNFQELQRELSDVEDKLAAARRALNAAVSRYNTGRESFPAVVFAGMLGFQEADFHRLDDSEKGVVDQVPDVAF